MTTTKTANGGFKTKIAELERKIRKAKKDLERLVRLETASRNRWTKAYQAVFGNAMKLAELKVAGTKKQKDLGEKVTRWPKESQRLTKERDLYREKIKTEEQKLAALGAELATVKEQELNETRSVDEIVTQVFGLNDAVVRASTDREACLKRHVFPRLLDEKGKLRRQVSFTSSNGLRRVVAMVNTLTVIQGDLAAKAKQLIQEFFDRFQKAAAVDEVVRPLYELTRELLVERVDFKVGPDLYRFISMELDEDIFPELAQAQALLRQSIRSEKTTSYIRIYQRKDRTHPWEVVPQS